MSPERKVEFYALSTCGWCRKTKVWLDENRVNYQVIYMDLVSGPEKESAKERVLNFVSRLTFPILIIDDGRTVIQGFQPDKFSEELR